MDIDRNRLQTAVIAKEISNSTATWSALRSEHFRDIHGRLRRLEICLRKVALNGHDVVRIFSATTLKRRPPRAAINGISARAV